jgi:hypothetical protein
MGLSNSSGMAQSYLGIHEHLAAFTYLNFKPHDYPNERPFRSI